MTRALVLGGGGLTGIAWESGVLMGLADAGVDVRHWDRVVGTSAGSVVGARILGDPEFDAWFGQQLIEAGPEEDEHIRAIGGRAAAAVLRLGRRRGLGWTRNVWLTLFALETYVRQRARPPRPLRTTGPARLREFVPADPALARVGNFGLAARTASEAVYRAVMRERLEPIADWPPNLVVTAIDVDSGATVAIDEASGVPFLDAIAASCAVPTLMPAVTIGGRRYMDGGMASQTHGDLARGFDEVFIVAPLDLGRLDAEVRRLRADGSRVTVVTPGRDAQRAIGRAIALLDPARRARSAQAGLLDGRRAAREAADEGPAADSPPRTRLAGSEG